MKTYRFACGSGTVEFPLEEKNIIGELHGNVAEPISDIRKELWASLDAPIDSAPLCRRVTSGSTVALVVSDISRFWMRQDLVVPHLVDYLTQRCGVSESDITIVIANGTHTGGDEAELRTLVTDAVYDRIEKIPYLSLVRPKGTFYLFPGIERTGLDEKQFCKALLERAHIWSFGRTRRASVPTPMTLSLVISGK